MHQKRVAHLLGQLRMIPMRSRTAPLGTTHLKILEAKDTSRQSRKNFRKKRCIIQTYSTATRDMQAKYHSEVQKRKMSQKTRPLGA